MNAKDAATDVATYVTDFKRTITEFMILQYKLWSIGIRTLKNRYPNIHLTDFYPTKVGATKKPR